MWRVGGGVSWRVEVGGRGYGGGGTGRARDDIKESTHAMHTSTTTLPTTLYKHSSLIHSTRKSMHCIH